ncbi:hypothetical protein QBC39DRAFT_432288 [Podospora conica]|nr:hypothetical protein QBC39DRAFT_432288 [Schizothecium conicum]
MCLKEIYYNTYADGAKDVTEKLYPCREGRVSHQPDVHKYDRTLPYTSKSRDGIPDSPRALRSSHHFLGDLPTPPRRSKSPSPAHRERRDSVTYIPGSGVAEMLKASSKHLHTHHERLPTRRSSRHQHHHVVVPPSPPMPPALPKLKRSMTSPHYVVIEQDQPRLGKHDLPIGGPIHVVDEAPRPRRRNSAKAYVVQDDERERRREKRDQKRRLSTTSPFPEVTTAGPSSIPKVYVSEPPRLGLRRSNTATATIAASLASTTSIGSSSAAKQHPSKRLRFEDEVRRARERQNAEISKRMSPPEVHQEAAAAGGLKGILKKATGSFKGKERAAAEPTSREREELDLYDRDRLAARFGGDEGGSDTARDRRSRRSKVFMGDRYQYL